MRRFEVLFLFLGFSIVVESRIHHLMLRDDSREQITFSTFGFLKNGYLQCRVRNLGFNKHINLKAIQNSLAFVIEKTDNGGYSSFTARDRSQDFCQLIRQFEFKEEEAQSKDKSAKMAKYLLDTLSNKQHGYSMAILPLDLIESKMYISRIGKDMRLLSIQPISGKAVPAFSQLASNKSEEKNPDDETSRVLARTIDLTYRNSSKSFEFNFEVRINSNEEEGLYKLNIFNCYKSEFAKNEKLFQSANLSDEMERKREDSKFMPLDNYYLFDLNDELRFGIDLDVEVVEKNEESYLSAGELPVPTLYLTWSILYFLAALSWMYILKSSKGDVFKVHYLMLTLVFIKSMSLTFHAINLHYISVNGIHEAIWAILFYITYVIRGMLLIVIILLVGTGWTFIKHVLTENERRLFAIILPSQLLAITAYIFLEEIEEGDAVYLTWRQLFFLLDLICCAAILFPVVWSIRHLEQASQTDGKMVLNLKKLKIFKHFYLMVIFYIYFTRIIGFLLQQILPFQYEWFDELAVELVTFTFFVMTAYKFQPASSNPYLQLNQEDQIEDEEVRMDEMPSALVDERDDDTVFDSASVYYKQEAQKSGRKQVARD
nr:G protein-coupled receptor [Proales similis]